MARLFGESLFGPWSDPDELMAGGPRPGRKRGRLGKRLVIVLLAALAIGGGVWLTRRGLARQEAQARASVAKDVAAFLAEGELERLAQFLALLSPAEGPTATDPYHDLIVEAEAVLFRYHDAAPARLARVEQHATTEAAQPTLLLARMTVAPGREGRASYDRLVAAEAQLTKNPAYRTLMATVEEQRGHVAAARESWERSAQAGPLWLPHRYLQAAFEARQRNTAAVERLVQHMAKVAPTSPWTRLAAQRFGAGTPTAAEASSTPPVATYHGELAASLAAFAAGQRRAAGQALERALAAVGNQTPFVLDAFDALAVAKADALAAELVELEAWPRGNPAAQARLDELRARAAGPAHAASPPSAAPTANELPAAAGEAQGAKAAKAAKAKAAKAKAAKAKAAKQRGGKLKATGKKRGGRRAR